MGDFFDFFAQHETGTLVFLVLLVVSTALFVWVVQKVCWIGEFGRYKHLPRTIQAESSVGVIISAFFAKLIDEFRHLLALLIFLLFAGVLVYGVAVASSGVAGTARLEAIEKVIQVIVASLGGLVGSIMGYYFGEARGKVPPAAPPVQGPAAPLPSPVPVVPSQAVAPTPPPG